MIAEIVIGQPLVSPESLGFTDYTVTNERWLPRIIVSLGFFKSTSQVLKNRPDLNVTLDTVDFLEYKVGKGRLWIIVGVDKEIT